MTNQDNGGMSYTEGMNITREGAEVPEDKTPQNKTYNQTGWISVKDRLPENLEKVLIVFEYSDNILMANYQNGLAAKGFYVYYADGRKLTHSPITHWMPLPEPPK